MATCRNCGLELFSAQRFCRACGAPTEELSDEQVPTRMMPPQPDAWGSRGGASTAPTSRPDTMPVYDPSVGYQPSVPPPYPSTVPPYAPPKKRSPLGWIVAALAMGLFVLVVVAVMFIARAGRIRRDIPQGGRQRVEQPQQGEIELTDANADTADTSGGGITLTKSFPFDGEGKFSVNNVNGNISIQTWDQPKADVRVIKQSSDRSAQVFFTNTNGTLAFRTGGGGRDTRFEITLPREVGRVTLKSVNGSIKMDGVTGQIFADTVNGQIELTNVAGVSKVQTVNGRIKALLDEASDGPMEFSTQNGGIELTLKSDFEADLEASTEHGGINIDEQFGIPVQKELSRQSARGQIGGGGQLLKLRTNNGPIKLSK
jgi:hypothetical protein